MIDYREYIRQTEPICRKLFDALSEYRDLYRATISPIAVIRHTGEGDFDEKYKIWRQEPEIERRFAEAEDARIRLDGQLFSMHVVSGSILHIAYQAIQLYSTKNDFPENYAYLLDRVDRGIKTVSKYAIGRDVHGIPIGLVVYAGRNQYNHIDASERLNAINQNVFRALAKYKFEEFNYLNPAFMLENEHLDSYSTNIISVLDWDCYDKFQRDLNDALPDA